ncbi:MAG: hypothetical protein K2W96_10065 [Gemmataceae bacterium]|nr:hypothetical protein [Gemmataceae bacterium]
MNVPLTLAGHLANWRFRSSQDFDNWLNSRPWNDRGGVRVLRLGAASLGDLMARAVRRAVRGHDDGERDIHVPILPFPKGGGTPLQVLQQAVDMPGSGGRPEQLRQVVGGLRAYPSVAVVLPPESAPPAGWAKSAAALVDELRKFDEEARATFVLLDTAAHPLSMDPFDFTVGGPSDAVLASEAALWRAYAHARLAWETAGDAARAQRWDEQGFARLGVSDDALEDLLSRMSEEDWKRLPVAVQGQVREHLKRLFQRPAPKLPAELAAHGAFWRPVGDQDARPSPWLARALLRLGLAGEAAFYLRGSLVCAPLAHEVLGRCFDLEARERAAGWANRGTMPPPPDASDRYRKFEEGQASSGAQFYPKGCPARPADAWAFTVFGEFLASLPFDRTRSNFTNGLRTLRNALAHGHYISWAVLQALKRLEKEGVG